MSNNLSLPVPRGVSIGATGSTSKAGSTFSTAYVYATSGNCIGVRFTSPVTQTLTDVWFFVNTVTGTPGNTTCEVRDFLAGNTLKPGTNLLASQTVSPGTTTGKWINAHFASPASLTQDVTYWIVLGDAAGSVGNNIAVINRGGLTFADGVLQNRCVALTSSDGFTTNGAATNTNAPIILKFADGTLLGTPYTTTGTPAGNSRERGIKIAGLTEQLTINAVLFFGDSRLSGIKIYKGATAPGGTTELTVTFGAGVALTGVVTIAPFTFLKNTVYRVVLTFGSNAGIPNYYQIEDPATTTDTINCGFGGGSMYWTIDNGSGGWDDSNTDKFPQMMLVVQDQVSIAAGGGLLINPGMSGGFNG